VGGRAVVRFVSCAARRFVEQQCYELPVGVSQQQRTDEQEQQQRAAVSGCSALSAFGAGAIDGLKATPSRNQSGSPGPVSRVPLAEPNTRRRAGAGSPDRAKAPARFFRSTSNGFRRLPCILAPCLNSRRDRQRTFFSAASAFSQVSAMAPGAVLSSWSHCER